MTEDDKQFLVDSIKSHDQQIGQLVEKVDKLSEKVDKLSDKVDKLSDKIDKLADQVYIMVDSMNLLIRQSANHETRIRHLENPQA